MPAATARSLLINQLLAATHAAGSSAKKLAGARSMSRWRLTSVMMSKDTMCDQLNSNTSRASCMLERARSRKLRFRVGWWKR